ncbi:MAG: DUF4836 family protein [Saprospiraceae bacterium]|nr:DUF4836 family protein [Saprospiraceae bacterium]
MKAQIKNFIFAGLGLFLMASCNKTANLDDASKAIPKDAVSVTAINAPSMFQKADFESVKQMDFYKAMVDSASSHNTTMADILRDPRKSGVDFTKNIYLVQDYQIGKSDAGTVALMSLSNAGDFENLLKNSSKDVKIESKDGIKFIVSTPKTENTAPTNEDGFNYADRNKERATTVAWNDKMAIIGDFTEGGGFRKYFNLKAGETVAANAQFGKLLAAKHDVYTYMSFDKLADDASIKTGAGAMNIDPKDLKGNYAMGYADFENGEIVSKSDYQINAGLRKEWGLMFKDNVKTDFSKYLKGNNLGFAMTLALDMKGIKEIINTSPQLKGAIELGKGSDSFSTDDIFKAFDGDVVVAAAPNVANTSQSSDKKWAGMMGFKLQDKATMLKLVNYLVAQKALVAEGGDVYHFSGAADMVANGYVDNGKLAIVDDVIFLGDATTVSGLKTGNSVTADVKDILNKNIMGVYANFNQIFATTEGLQNPQFGEMKMTMTGKNAEATLKTRDANENALKSLMKSINQWYLTQKAENAKRSTDDRKII